MFDLDQNKHIDHSEEFVTPNPTSNKDAEDLINFKDINSNSNQQAKYANEIGGNFSSFANNKDTHSFNKNDFLNIVAGGDKPKEEAPKIVKLRTIQQEDDDLKRIKEDENWSERSSGRDTEKQRNKNNDKGMKNIVKSKKIFFKLI